MKMLAILIILTVIVGCIEEKESDIVYITNTGTKYHRAGCRYLKNSAILIERQEAIAKGYTACSVCKP